MHLRELLNDRKWHAGDLRSLAVTVRHRGSPGDERVVLGHEIVDIGPNGLRCAVDVEVYGVDGVDDGTVFLPYHRILRVIGPEGVLWARAGSEEPEEP